MKILSLFGLLFLTTHCNLPGKKYSTEDLEDKAFAAYKSGNYPASIRYYDQLIERDSLNGNYYYGRGYSFSRMIQTKESIRDYLKAAALGYKQGSCYYNIGLMNTFLDDSIALIYFKKAVELNPERSDIQNEYQECLERIKENSQ